MKTIIRIFVLPALYILIGVPAFSQNNTSARLDSFFNSLHHYGQLNGNVLIAQQGQVSYKQSFGYANFENKTRNNAHTAMSLSSISKIFTSTAVLQLRDKGKFKLDDPVSKYLPDFPYPDITIRHLLSHTSGLPDYQLYEDLINKNPGKIFTNKDVLPALKLWKKPLSFKPGDKWEYSNTNFCLLALLVEKVSGMAFSDYLRKNIFGPAKMFDTYIATESTNINPAVNYDFPFLYSANLKNADSIEKYHWRLYNASGFLGQGNIMSTTGDMLKFDDALYAGKIVRQSTLKEAFTPAKFNNGKDNAANAGGVKCSYGLGWFILTDTGGGKIVYHTGGQPGALSIFIRNITKRQTVILFDNTFDKSLYRNGFNALTILNNGSFVIPKIDLVHKYGSTVVEKGIDAAYCKLLELKSDTIHYYLNENSINELGLELLYSATFDKDHALALEVLKTNTLLFPNSFNTFDSYGEALAKAGKKNEAIQMYKKSIELNPQNDGGKEALEKLTR